MFFELSKLSLHYSLYFLLLPGFMAAAAAAAVLPPLNKAPEEEGLVWPAAAAAEVEGESRPIEDEGEESKGEGSLVEEEEALTPPLLVKESVMTEPEPEPEPEEEEGLAADDEEEEPVEEMEEEEEEAEKMLVRPPDPDDDADVVEEAPDGFNGGIAAALEVGDVAEEVEDAPPAAAAVLPDCDRPSEG